MGIVERLYKEIEEGIRACPRNWVSGGAMEFIGLNLTARASTSP